MSGYDPAPVRILLDAGAVRRLADGSGRSVALLSTLRQRGLWPAQVPTVVVAEALSGELDADRHVEALLRCCAVVTEIDGSVARRAAWLLAAVNRGSTADALLVALAEPGGAILVANRPSVEAMALFATGVFVERV